MLRFICLTMGKWFRGSTNKKSLWGSTPMHPAQSPCCTALFSCQLVLYSCWIDSHVNYGLKRTNLFTWKLVLKRVSGRCISPSSKLMESSAVGSKLLRVPKVSIPNEQPLLGTPWAWVWGQQLWSERLEEDCKEGVNEWNCRATFSIKAITGIVWFWVSLVTVQLACSPDWDRQMPNHTGMCHQENSQWHIQGPCLIVQIPGGSSLHTGEDGYCGWGWVL